MASDPLVLLVLLLFGLAFVILIVALLAYVSDSSRRARREEYHPPAPPRPPVTGTTDGERIRWGSVESLYEEDAPRAENRITWGVEGLEPSVAEAPPDHHAAPFGGQLEQEKCPVCRARFGDTQDKVVIRCAVASCRTLTHQECLSFTHNSCPICHGTNFVAAHV